MNPFRYFWILLLAGGLIAINTMAGISYLHLPAPRPATTKGIDEEQDRLEQEARKAQRAREAEEERKADEARKAEEAREAETRKVEETHKGEERRIPEEVRKAEEGKKREQFERKVRQAEKLLGKKSVRTGLTALEEALEILPGEAPAVELRQTAKKTLEKFETDVQQGEAKLKISEFDDALKLLEAAADLVSDDPKLPGLLAEAKKKAKAPPSTPLQGDVLVVVLYTKTSSLAGASPQAFVEQLEKVRERHKAKLLDKKLYVLTRTGRLQEWTKDLKVSDTNAFPNDRFDEMFETAFREIKKLNDRAANKKVVSVLIWETDCDPALETKRAIKVPEGQKVKLCLRWALGEKTLKKPEGFADMAQPMAVEAISGLVRDLLDDE